MIFRSLIFIICGFMVAYGASWLSRQDGTSSMTWLGYQIEIETSYLVVIIAGLVIAAIVIDRLIRALVRWPRLFSSGWQARRRHKGEKALSLGFVALAAGDLKAASREARRAEKLLETTILTDLLIAQSAHAKGDVKAASQYFKKLANEKDTAYFGQLGLMRLHQEDSGGQISNAALTAAQKAFALDPTSAEAAHMILKQALQDKQWRKAIDCLKIYMNHSGGQSQNEIDKAKNLYAQLVTHRAKAEAETDVKQARALCEDALREAPDFIPAHAQLVALYREKNDKRAAMRAADKAFTLMPQKDSLLLVAQTRQDNDGQLISHLTKLAGRSSYADEAYLAIAEFAIEVGIWASASQSLGQISDKAIKSNHLYLVKAQIAKAQEDDEAHKDALRLAATAPRAGQWSCQACHHHPEEYRFICPSCEAPAQIDWQWPKTKGPKTNGLTTNAPATNALSLDNQ